MWLQRKHFKYCFYNFMEFWNHYKCVFSNIFESLKVQLRCPLNYQKFNNVFLKMGLWSSPEKKIPEIPTGIIKKATRESDSSGCVCLVNVVLMPDNYKVLLQWGFCSSWRDELWCTSALIYPDIQSDHSDISLQPKELTQACEEKLNYCPCPDCSLLYIYGS